MNRISLLLLLTLSLGVSARAQGQKLAKPDKVELPELNVIKTVALAPCYSCRTAEEFARGYEQTALFLTEYSRRRNSPALLFNGSPGSGADYFMVSMAGSEMSLIADLGAGFELAGLTAQDFGHGVVQPGGTVRVPMQFRVHESPITVGHTYAVVINKGEYRGLLFFTVTAYEPNQRVELRYALKHFEALKLEGRSPGFDWTARSTSQQ